MLHRCLYLLKCPLHKTPLNRGIFPICPNSCLNREMTITSSLSPMVLSLSHAEQASSQIHKVLFREWTLALLHLSSKVPMKLSINEVIMTVMNMTNADQFPPHLD